MDNTKLSDCPFCNAPLTGEGESGDNFYQHPNADCIFGGWEFPNLDFAAWNRRATDAPAQGEQMPVAWAELRKRAEAASKDIIRSHGWQGTVEMLDAMRVDEQYLLAASPAAIIELLDAAERGRASPVAADKPVAWGAWSVEQRRYVDSSAMHGYMLRAYAKRPDIELHAFARIVTPVAASADAAPAGAVAVRDPKLDEWIADLQKRLIVACKDQEPDIQNLLSEAACALKSAAAEVTPAPADGKVFALVPFYDMGSDHPSLAYFNGREWEFSDGDLYQREGDTDELAGHLAEFLTLHQLEQRLAATAAGSVPDDVAKLRAEVERLKRGQFILGQCVHNQVIAEQAAWIEWQHGEGAEAAMAWIHNGLVGPGHIPKCEGMTAQAYFDANYDDRMEPGDKRAADAQSAEGGKEKV